MMPLLTIKEQNSRLNELQCFTHKWSCRGYGSSRLILACTDKQISYRKGCGYDRLGACVGDLIEHFFKNELTRLAKRFAKTKCNHYKSSQEFYGLFLKKDGSVYLDGACGLSCMEKILNAIGFSLVRGGDTGNVGNTGSVFYYLKPVTKHIRNYQLSSIK